MLMQFFPNPTSFPSAASPKQTLLFLLQSLADVSRNPTFNGMSSLFCVYGISKQRCSGKPKVLRSQH